MNLKQGVRVNGIQPEIVIAIMVVSGVYERQGLPHTVTSICDGKHSDNSLHYAGLAFDNRTWIDDSGTQLSGPAKEGLAIAMRDALGPEFDVVVEATHIHVEFDPQ